MRISLSLLKSLYPTSPINEIQNGYVLLSFFFSLNYIPINLRCVRQFEVIEGG